MILVKIVDARSGYLGHTQTAGKNELGGNAVLYLKMVSDIVCRKKKYGVKNMVSNLHL